MSNLIQLANIRGHFDRKKVRQMKISGQSNQILYSETDKVVKLYIPLYSRMVLNSISQIDYKLLKVHIHCNIHLTINVTDLPPFLIYFLKKHIAIFFNNDDALLLDEDNEDDVQIYLEEEKEMVNDYLEHHYLHYEVRKIFVTTMVPNLFYTPFEDMDLILSVQAKAATNFTVEQYVKDVVREQMEDESEDEDDIKKKLKDTQFLNNRKKDILKQILKEAKSQQDKDNDFDLFQENIFCKDFKNYTESDKIKLRQITFCFNNMNTKRRVDKIYAVITSRNFGNYSVAREQLKVEYTHESAPKIIRERSDLINKRQQGFKSDEKQVDSKIKAFQYAHFQVKIFKNPVSAIATIFIPLWLLSIINMGIFWQNNELAGRIQNIAALMFAFISIVAVIQEQIPPSGSPCFIEYLVYLLTFTTIICLIEGLIIRNDDTYQPKFSDPFFLLALIISVLTLIAIVALLIIFYCFTKDKYVKTTQEIEDQHKFDHRYWCNVECDRKILKHIDNGTIKSLIPLKAEYKNRNSMRNDDRS